MGNNLVERLDSVGHLKDEVYAAFFVPHINPKESYWMSKLPRGKEAVVKSICNEVKSFGKYDGSFENSLKKLPYVKNNQANPLKRVNYGILSMGKLPNEFLDVLTNWEKVYFFRGRWSDRKPLFGLDFNSFILGHLVLGISKFEDTFYKFREFQKKNFQKNYSPINLPESNEIIKQNEEYIKFNIHIDKAKIRGKPPKKISKRKDNPLWIQTSLF